MLGYPSGTAGLCLPLHSRDLSPTRGKVPAAWEGSGRSTAKQTAPGRCHLPELPGPGVLPVLLGAGSRRRKRRRRESRAVGGKRGRRKEMGREGLDAVRRRIREVRGPSARQPPTMELHGGQGSEPEGASSRGDRRDLPAPSPRCLCCGLGQAAPGGRCRGLETILRP